MTYGEQNTETESHEQLDYSLAQGVNFIDTAEMYAIPPKEETQGRARRNYRDMAKKKEKIEIRLSLQQR